MAQKLVVQRTRIGMNKDIAVLGIGVKVKRDIRNIGKDRPPDGIYDTDINVFDDKCSLLTLILYLDT